MTSLKNVLLINALSSGATGIVLVLSGGFIANVFGLSEPLAFQGVGIFLIAFGILVLVEGRQKETRAGRVQLIIALDLLWVAGSLIIIVLQLVALSSLGYLLIAVVGLWVALMAWLQLKGLKKIIT